MADFVIANDLIATVPLDFTDATGKVKAPPGGSVSSSDPNVATVTLAADGGSVDITPVSDGTGIAITYTNPSLAGVPDAVLLVDVVEPSATSDSFDVANATFRPKTP